MKKSHTRRTRRYHNISALAMCLTVAVTASLLLASPAEESPATSPAPIPAKDTLQLEEADKSLRFLPAGSDDMLWLVRRNQSDFDVLARKLGEKWRWVEQAITPADPRCPVVAGEILHVFFNGGVHVWFDVSGGMTIGTNTPGDVLAACRATNWPGQVSQSLLVAIAQSSNSKADAAIGIFRLSASQWTKVAQLGVTSQAWAEQKAAVHLAEVGGRIYLLLSQPGSDSLARWDIATGGWEKLPRAFAAASQARPVGIQAAGNQLVALATLPTGQARLMTFDEKSKQFASLQTVKLNDKPAKLGEEVLFSALGDRLILCWENKGKTNLATCSLTGQAGPADDIQQLIDNMPEPELAQRLREYVVLGIVAVFIIITFALRPKDASAMFSLPTTMKPGNLMKRVIAFGLDFTPLAILGMACFAPEMLNKQPEELRAMLQAPEQIETTAIVYAQLLTLGVYIAYCIVMELRFGATLGKMALRLRVVESGGTKPGFRAVALRNITKAIELPVLAGHEIWFTAILFMLPVITRNRQRLGDMVARTAVISAKTTQAKPTPTDTPPTEKQ